MEKALRKFFVEFVYFDENQTPDIKSFHGGYVELNKFIKLDQGRNPQKQEVDYWKEFLNIQESFSQKVRQHPAKGYWESQLEPKRSEYFDKVPCSLSAELRHEDYDVDQLKLINNFIYTTSCLLDGANYEDTDKKIFFFKCLDMFSYEQLGGTIHKAWRHFLKHETADPSSFDMLPTTLEEILQFCEGHICVLCNKYHPAKKPEVALIRQHLRYVHAVALMKCDVGDCGVKFGRRYQLYQHKTSVHQLKLYECSFESCTMSFKTSQELKDHKKDDHKIKVRDRKKKHEIQKNSPDDLSQSAFTDLISFDGPVLKRTRHTTYEERETQITPNCTATASESNCSEKMISTREVGTMTDDYYGWLFPFCQYLMGKVNGFYPGQDIVYSYDHDKTSNKYEFFMNDASSLKASENDQINTEVATETEIYSDVVNHEEKESVESDANSVKQSKQPEDDKIDEENEENEDPEISLDNSQAINLDSDCDSITEPTIKKRTRFVPSVGLVLNRNT